MRAQDGDGRHAPRPRLSDDPPQGHVAGQTQAGTKCHLSANSGLPAIVVAGGFTSDGMPVGVELIGRVE